MIKRLPNIAYPTLLLFFFSFFGFFLNIHLCFQGHYSEAFGAVISIVLLYLSFVPLHEASHGNIFNALKTSKKLNNILGNLSGLLLFTPLPIFRLMHNKHHGFANHPTKDPDYWVKGKGPVFTFIKILTLYLRYYYLYFKSKSRNKLTVTLCYNAIFSIAFFILAETYGAQLILLLWVLPATIALIILAIAFDYIPHYPHNDQSRYNNSRTIISKSLNWFMTYQNYHIIHHLHPRVPFYLYEKAYKNLSLEEREKHTRVTSLKKILSA